MMNWLTGSVDVVWGIIGMLVAGAMFWAVNKRVLRLQSYAAENLAKLLEKQVDLTTKERDDYREKLHCERNEHQKTQLYVKELEQRPDLTSLTVLLTEQKGWMRALGDNLMKHSESDAEIFGELRTSLRSIADTLSYVATNNKT